MKLLIVEDELSLQGALCKGFNKLGYAVDSASDGEEALELYYSSFYDAIILDLNLPKLDGIDVLREIRKEDSKTKIIILSARSEVEDKILGLDMGANDYLAKPFHFRELDARVRALLRRDFSVMSPEITVSGLTVDTSLKKAFYQGREIPLTKKEYGILVLVHQPGLGGQQRDLNGACLGQQCRFALQCPQGAYQLHPQEVARGYHQKRQGAGILCGIELPSALGLLCSAR